MEKLIDSLLEQSMSRREVIVDTAKLGAAAAASGALTLPFTVSAQAAEASPAAEAQETVRHSACLVNCGSRCALKVIVKDDRIVRIEPEDVQDDSVFGKHQIRPCLRGRSNRWRVYSPDRIKYPMKRVGKRGEGKFKRISWDEATSFIAAEIKRVSEQYGNEAIYFNYQSGAYYHTQGSPAWKRLLNLSGGYLQYYNNYSNAQNFTAASYTYGAKGTQFASHFSQVKNSDLVVFFGLNLSETRMSGGGQVEELRRALEASKARVIIIDPRYTDSVVTEHAEWLPIRPTTDAALVAGIAHTLIVEQLIDESLVNRYCIGYDRSTLPETAAPNASYKDYVLGTGDDGIEKTPEWAADICGIPAIRIRQLAREIAGARACFIAQGWGPQRHANGEQTARAVQILPALTGHFGLPGTNNGNWTYATAYGVPALPTETNPVKVSIPCYLWTDAIATPEKMTATTMGVKGADTLKTGIKLFFNQAGNALLNQHGNTNRTRKILEDESLCETIVVIDNHMTPSARYADILLPETTYLETEDLVDNAYASGSHNYMIAMQKTITPLGEVRSTYDICADIAKHLGLGEQFTLGRTQADWMALHYAQIKEKRTYLPEWEVAKNMGVIDQQIPRDEECIILADYRRDPQGNPLTTPSGKIEIYSQALADLAKSWTLPEGDRIPAVPEFCVVKESHLNKDLTARYPLQMSGFHTKGHTHSTYANLLMLHEAIPDEVWINPIDASARQLTSGDLVHVFNDRGVVAMPCKVTQRILPGVVAMPQGAWTRLDSNGVDVGGCINTLTSHLPSPLAKANPQHTNLVEVKRA
ncbi:DMSO/selenate family reductase complex A subunit [Intestinirhabdus alba]|uniref:Molybdopterin-dependent oxidoreductase n=1 Tax=Intestinirhabdus alba TaxID=2899544 RepID=A0A6L6IIB3_9ENTR|nr:DMSO/selenate family reductase complex A subunit [Intestinirhabdus alba]MTH46591.1 molybdopterin-dependent oxidoreductase [Intestinirhabdus alba]